MLTSKALATNRQVSTESQVARLIRLTKGVRWPCPLRTRQGCPRARGWLSLRMSSFPDRLDHGALGLGQGLGLPAHAWVCRPRSCVVAEAIIVGPERRRTLLLRHALDHAGRRVRGAILVTRNPAPASRSRNRASVRSWPPTITSISRSSSL